MKQNINFRKIYKEAFVNFKKYKLLRVFGLTQIASDILLSVCILLIMALLMLAQKTDSTDALLISFYYFSVTVFTIFIILVYLVIKNWAVGSLTKSVENISQGRPVSIAIGSTNGKIFLVRLISLDLLVWMHYLMLYILVDSANIYFSFLFPSIYGLIFITTWLIKLFFFFAGNAVVIYGARSIVIDNKKAIQALQIGLIFFKNNILNTFMLIIVNLCIIAPFFVTFALVYLLTEALSIYFRDINQIVSLFFYSFGNCIIILIALTSWIFYGSYQVFINSVWTKFYTTHQLRKVLVKKYHEKK